MIGTNHHRGHGGKRIKAFQKIIKRKHRGRVDSYFFRVLFERILDFDLPIGRVVVRWMRNHR